ncbi:hypothetical protein AcW1_008467 [Taiwanofungus camphoratus]|nr:hypothetical protein AcW1_008467 [Antrodia cinnamomea]
MHLTRLLQVTATLALALVSQVAPELCAGGQFIESYVQVFTSTCPGVSAPLASRSASYKIIQVCSTSCGITCSDMSSPANLTDCQSLAAAITDLGDGALLVNVCFGGDPGLNGAAMGPSVSGDDEWVVE